MRISDWSSDVCSSDLFLGVALAFGLTVVTMVYAIGHISGGHLHTAVTVGLWAGGRFDARDIPLYVIAQVLGAIVAAWLLYYLAPGRRSEERRVGKACVSTCRYRWSPVHSTNKPQPNL